MLDKMVSMESYIANLEKEIGELKEKREPTDELLRRTKRDPGSQRGNVGQEFLQGRGGSGMEVEWKGVEADKEIADRVVFDSTTRTFTLVGDPPSPSRHRNNRSA